MTLVEDGVLVSPFDVSSVQVSDDLTALGLSVSLGLLTYSVKPPIGTGGVQSLVSDTVATLETSLAGETPSAVPEIQATRAAFKRTGKDPSRYRPSSEALLRRIASGKGLYHVNDVVDLSNVISVHTRLPVCTYDLDCVLPPIMLRRGSSGESYQGIGRSRLNLEGLPVFADERGPFGTPFSDSERTKIRETTAQILSILVCFGTGRDLSSDLAWSKTLLQTGLGIERVETNLIRKV